MSACVFTLPPVAVLAGGLATRMHPLTERVPKSLLPVAGKPFVFHQLNYLAGQGVERVVFCLGHMGEQIIDVIGDGAEFGLRVEYSWDGEIPLGTGGAIANALPLLGNEFFVLYGDSYLRCNYGVVYRRFIESVDKDGLMTVYKNNGAYDASNIVFEGGEIIRYDKKHGTADMRHIDYGLSILRAETLTEVPGNAPFDLALLFKKLVKKRRMAGFEVVERFYEIGSQEGLAELDALLG